MLTTLFPRAALHYASLSLFGPVLGDFAAWLLEQGYTEQTLRNMFHFVIRMDRFFLRRGIDRLEELSSGDFQRCWHALKRPLPTLAGTALVMERFLQGRGVLQSPPSPLPSPLVLQVERYSAYLRTVRGFSPSTVHQHLCTTQELLTYLHFEKNTQALRMLDARTLEAFLKKTATHSGRGTLQHVVAQLRGFLRYLATTGQIRPGLECQIDTPRCYRLEQLPRSLPWSTVEAFLRSIRRTTPMGRRDYTMFSLMSAYGLRSKEVVSLTLDDIDWHAGSVHIRQTKTRRALELPLTDSVASVLIDYLKTVKRPEGYRELFLRMRAPTGRLKPTAVTEAFQAWSRRSGLAIPFQGAHCLRHSYAVHLLRQGTPLKTIGDLLGHNSAESTAVYLRLATEDLREVGLPVPASSRNEAEP